MHPPEGLVQLSRRLGEPSADLAILAEGNTSCVEGASFWVKASGNSLRDIEADGFVLCEPSPLIEAFDRQLTDEEVTNLLARSTKSSSRRPSVEAFMHAWLLSLPGVTHVGHVHPTPILSLVCSPSAQSLCRMRFFPDEVVCCGVATAWVPYVDPGLQLAVRIKESVTKFVREHGESPKVIWLQNHGVIALGRSPLEVESAILMNVKAARVILMAGGIPAVEKDKIIPLSPANVERIHSRPDEHHRQELLWKLGDKH